MNGTQVDGWLAKIGEELMAEVNIKISSQAGTMSVKSRVLGLMVTFQGCPLFLPESIISSETICLMGSNMLKLSFFLDLEIGSRLDIQTISNNYMGNNSNTVLGAENPALKSYFGGYLFTSPTFARDWFGMGRWALN